MKIRPRRTVLVAAALLALGIAGSASAMKWTAGDRSNIEDCRDGMFSSWSCFYDSVGNFFSEYPPGPMS